MIKNFNDFIFESEDKDTRIVDLFSSVTRNYESSRAFYTDQLQYHVEEERRDWRNTRKYAELEEVITHESFYKLKFSLDEKSYLIEINFNFSFNGSKDKDTPDAMNDDTGTLNVILEKIDIKKIRIKSTDIDYVSSDVSSPIRKACELFLVKVLEEDYDTLGADVYKIEQ
jgi:hypothetical protein